MTQPTSEVTIRRHELPAESRSAHERWSEFLFFLVGWVLAAVVGSALLFRFVVDPCPSPRTPGPLGDGSPEPRQPSAPVELPLAPAQPVEPVGEDPKRLEPSTELEKARFVVSHLLRAAELAEAGEYDEAIRTYEAVLAIDPYISEIEILIAQMVNLRELETLRAQAPAKRFRETPTEFHPPPSTEPRGSSGGGGVDVKRAGASVPAEVIIRFSPQTPNPGEPYVLRVLMYNFSNNTMWVESIELVAAHESMKSERGRRLIPRKQQIRTRETALLWEGQGVWTAADSTGTVEVAITLVGGAGISKKIGW